MYAAITDALRNASDYTFTMLASYKEFLSPAIDAEWNNLMMDPRLAVAWNTPRPNPYARGLFRFASLARLWLAHLDSQGKERIGHVLLLCDCQDWLVTSSPLHDGTIELPMPAQTSGTDLGFQVRCLQDKQSSSYREAATLLGLVDSEVWSEGRMQSAQLPKGGTVRERFLDWRARGRPMNEEVLLEEDDDAMLGRTSRDYVNRFQLTAWKEGRLLILNEESMNFVPWNSKP